VGHADTRPVTANLDVEQRAKNRRVEVVILEQAPPAPQYDAGNTAGSEEPPVEEGASSPLP